MTHGDETRFARLTAFALGELPDEEHAEIEALMARDEAARLHVEEIRALDGALRESV